MSYVTLGDYHSKPQTYYVSRPGHGAYGGLHADDAKGRAPMRAEVERARRAEARALEAARRAEARALEAARQAEIRALEAAQRAEDRAAPPPVDIPPPPAAPNVEMEGEGFDDFSCPVCFEFFGSCRIFQCSAGHSLCHACAFALDPKLCPQCRASISGRNIALEGAVRSLLLHLNEVEAAAAPPGVNNKEATPVVDKEGACGAEAKNWRERCCWFL